jgi:hypothetical protein
MGAWLKISQHSLVYPLDLRKKLAPSRDIPKGRNLVHYLFSLNYEGLALNRRTLGLLAHSLPMKDAELPGGF